jgi:hypothetical protein
MPVGGVAHVLALLDSPSHQSSKRAAELNAHLTEDSRNSAGQVSQGGATWDTDFSVASHLCLCFPTICKLLRGKALRAEVPPRCPIRRRALCQVSHCPNP